ncbi:Nitrogen regulatory protein [Polystyrenella longa]|uniref:Nitrogen regulatory protein n=1 Tax=Polystyrenella longa TaxID=2528007 RepID=A0A518CH22_9PLAN|nr:PTS sugar transporter subunit IIA [Polystyrenella longa]QDU78521.1 Nitrogen regulatory protein [Polystyrenella longa]
MTRRMMMELMQQIIDDKLFLLDLDARDMKSVLEQTVQYIVDHDHVEEAHQTALLESLMERERIRSTAIGHAVAVPHAYLEGVPRPMVVFVRLKHSLNLGAPDRIPTRFVCVLLGPPNAVQEHLDALTLIAQLMSDDEFRYEAGAALNEQQLADAFQHFVLRNSPEASAQAKIPEGMHFSGKFLGGIIQDVQRRVPHYVSDFVDGLNAKTIASSVFLFFACLAPAITFGGIMGQQTDGSIGAVEMLVATAACGVIYALIGGQPMTILGGIGPMLVFTKILYDLCQSWDVQFLSAYAWVGFWTAGFLFLFAVTEASCLMRFFTRFTDEIFAALMSLIFIYESVRNLLAIFNEGFENGGRSHDTSFLSLLLALGTFYIAMSLMRMRRSRYLVPYIREFLADFGPAIAMGIMIAIAWMWSGEVELHKLTAPAGFNTTSGRSWLVNPFDTPGWLRMAAAGPALLAALLIALSQNITSRLLNSPDLKMKKGSAYHYDLLLIGLMVGVCSLFGLPWLVAATVRSLAHVRALATVEEVVSPNAETKEQVIHVNENRLTGLVIHVFIGFSILLLPYLQITPLSVLYGLFLYMGVVSLFGNQFFERLGLLVMDSNLYPQTHYMRRVPPRTIHRFTIIQLACLTVLCLVNLSDKQYLKILFPLFIALLVPVRLLMNKLFQRDHLLALDADEEPKEEEMQWAG